MVRLADTLQFSFPEELGVASVRNLVVRDCGRDDEALSEAALA